MLTAAGTSTAACLPFFMASTAMGVCKFHGVGVYTRSTSLLSQTAFQPSSPLNSLAFGLPDLASCCCARAVRAGARTAVPQPDDTDAHDVQFRRGVSTHVKCLLAISTLYAVGETFFGFTSEGK